MTITPLRVSYHVTLTSRNNGYGIDVNFHENTHAPHNMHKTHNTYKNTHKTHHSQDVQEHSQDLHWTNNTHLIASYTHVTTKRNSSHPSTDKYSTTITPTEPKT